MPGYGLYWLPISSGISEFYLSILGEWMHKWNLLGKCKSSSVLFGILTRNTSMTSQDWLICPQIQTDGKPMWHFLFDFLLVKIQSVNRGSYYEHLVTKEVEEKEIKRAELVGRRWNQGATVRNSSKSRQRKMSWLFPSSHLPAFCHGPHWHLPKTSLGTMVWSTQCFVIKRSGWRWEWICKQRGKWSAGMSLSLGWPFLRW